MNECITYYSSMLPCLEGILYLVPKLHMTTLHSSKEGVHELELGFPEQVQYNDFIYIDMNESRGQKKVTCFPREANRDL